MNIATQMLIASSNVQFLHRFETACAVASIPVGIASDGYEALTRLEQGAFDVLLLDGGYPGSKNALKGISADDLAHMWRQIEGRGRRLIIGYVTDRDFLEPDDGQIIDASKASMKEKLDALEAIVGHGKRDKPQPSRFFLDPAVHAFNRGADHHFWSDQSETDVIRKLVEAVDASKEAVSNAAKGGPDGRVIRLAYHKRLMR